LINNIIDKKEYKNILLLEKLNDTILKLPNSIDAYFELLGAQTRKHLKYYQRRIVKEISNFKIVFLKNKDILFDHIYNVVELNRFRMKSKGNESAIDDTYCINLYKYAYLKGLLCLCYVGNEIIGGTINWVLDDQAFLHVIAHDNRYNKYNVGQIALINTIQYFIESGIKTYHMCWGDSEYKYRFLCKRCNSYDVVFYRRIFDFYRNKIIYDIYLMMKHLKKQLAKNKLARNIYYSLKNGLNQNCQKN
jgi:CelD/BcsL family acetyltransferase involved in cellulose biosynthesis